MIIHNSLVTDNTNGSESSDSEKKKNMMRQMIKYFHKLISISFLGMNNMNPQEKLKRKEKKKKRQNV